MGGCDRLPGKRHPCRAASTTRTTSVLVTADGAGRFEHRGSNVDLRLCSLFTVVLQITKRDVEEVLHTRCRYTTPAAECVPTQEGLTPIGAEHRRAIYIHTDLYTANSGRSCTYT